MTIGESGIPGSHISVIYTFEHVLYANVKQTLCFRACGLLVSTRKHFSLFLIYKIFRRTLLYFIPYFIPYFVGLLLDWWLVYFAMHVHVYINVAETEYSGYFAPKYFAQFHSWYFVTFAYHLQPKPSILIKNYAKNYPCYCFQVWWTKWFKKSSEF